MLIEGWFDGVCEPYNPGGHVAYGAAVTIDGQVVFEEAKYVGVGSGMTSNVGEYAGVTAVLRYLVGVEGSAIIRGDSNMVVNQLNGKWRAKQGAYLPYYHVAKELWDEIRERCQLVWIPREQNNVCDSLSKQVLKDRGVEFRIQPEDGSKPQYWRKYPASRSGFTNRDMASG